MNKIEELKRERDGLDIRDAIAGYAKTGWESITEDDVQRLKWYGLFLRQPTPGFFMIRVRIPGGITSCASTAGAGRHRLTAWQWRARPHDAATVPTSADPY